MSDRPPHAAEVVRRLGGSALRRDILRSTTLHALRRDLASGALRRTAWGTYTLVESQSPRHAAVAARGVLSHETAAAHWMLERWAPQETVHVTVPPRARPTRARGVTLHFAPVAPHEDIDGVTAPLRTVLDCAATLPFPSALAIADSALRRGLVTGDDLNRAAARRRGAGARAVREVAVQADGRAANPFESALRAVAVRTGAGDFRPQVPVPLQGGTAYVDLGDPELRIALEADSFAYHGTREALDRDCRRYDELVRAGWLVLRFSWEQVALDQAWIADLVVDTVALRNPRSLRNRRTVPRSDGADRARPRP